MTNPQELKDKLGQTTEQLEKKLKDLAPFYTSLEPYQRGMLIIGLLLLLLISIYYLTKQPHPQVNSKMLAKKEKELEEKIMRQMAFYKRLKE